MPQYQTAKHRWLDERGGRTTEDVLEDERGEYVMMRGANGGDVRVYLPGWKYLMDEYRP